MAIAVPTLKELFEAGAHYGHKKEHSYPSSKDYVYTQKEGILIIDLQKTQAGLEKALEFVARATKENKMILFVSTKSQMQEKVAEIGKETGMAYASYKWFGGTLTNFNTILKSITKMKKLDEYLESEEFAKLTKRERVKFKEQLERKHHYLDGLKNLNKLPDILFVVDPVTEKVAVGEAKKFNLPIVAICDTNANADLIDYVIPANDDSVRTLILILDLVKQTILDSKPSLKTVIPPTEIVKKVSKITPPTGEAGNNQDTITK